MISSEISKCMSVFGVVIEKTVGIFVRLVGRLLFNVACLNCIFIFPNVVNYTTCVARCRTIMQRLVARI